MTDSPPHGQLTELEIGDDAEAWVAAGFAVQAGAIRLGDVTLRLVGGHADRGILGWSLHGVSTAVDGLPPVAAAHVAVEPAEHPNGVTSIDHLVVETDDFGRTIPELEAAGLELRRTRTFDLGDGERQQCFFWMGSVILELVGMVAPAPQAAAPARFWGLALISPDLETTAEHLGEATSPPKDAVQKGRRISTLRTRDLGISVPVAFMSPHVAG